MKVEKMTDEELDNEYDRLEIELERIEADKKIFPPTSFMGTLYMETTISRYKNKLMKIENEMKKRAGL